MLFTEGTHIKIDRTRCLNYRHNQVGCNHCQTNCPGKAIMLEQRKVVIDPESCLGCGLCLSTCPTEVFSANQWDETTIIKEVQDRQAAVTQLFCDVHDSPYLSKSEQNKGAIQIPACLSCISKGALYEIGIHTKLELRLDKCNSCQMNPTLTRLQHSIDVISEWLIASGYTPDITYLYEAEETIKRKKLKAVSSGMKVTSRRDLFLSLFNQSKETITQEKKSYYALNGRKKRRGQSLLPSWQKRLADTYNVYNKEGGQPAYWPSIHKKSTCVNCGMCSKNCPTQTLKIEMIDGKAIHTFNSGQCIDCRICQLFCPTESIIRDRQINENPFEVQVLLEKQTSECRKCGHVTPDTKESQCYWCENEASANEMISDVWSKLFGK